mgnify:FL=1
MLTEGIDSPDVADALSLTFVRSDVPPAQIGQVSAPAGMPDPDPYIQ